MKTSRAFIVGAAAALGAAIASCQLVAGLDADFVPAPDAGAPDAEADGGPTGCMAATYPDPPGGTDDGKDVGSIVVALHTVDVGDMATTPGFDLDHACTCTEDAGPTCVGPGSPTLYCDAPGGIDNQTAKIFKLLQIPLGSGSIGSQAFTNKINDGRWTLLIKIDGYNGEPDDPEVQVSLYSPLGLGAPPKWDGTDSWPVLSTAFDANGDPVYKATGAYVHDHVLVAAIPTIPMHFAGLTEQITVTVSTAVLTATLAKLPGTFRLVNGTVAGRWAITDVFQALSSYRDGNDMPLCTDAALAYTTLKSAVCSDADILVDDTRPKSSPCDALSFGMGFSADPALIGPKAPPPTPSPGCPMATDPAYDSCAK